MSEVDGAGSSLACLCVRFLSAACPITCLEDCNICCVDCKAEAETSGDNMDRSMPG